ncbi:MAG: ankyrin repeat domain-containing protein [Paracoccaceae bacterium]|nr:ankyrin repeat domain-containing protein [Paracoccaceae bacterium]
MRAAIIALMLTVASPAAGAECGNLCDLEWWKTATEADVQAELGSGADVMARTEDSSTPLHFAPIFGTLANIQALLAAGADVMARTEDGWTPLHFAAKCNFFCKSGAIQALLDAGADAKAKNKEGRTSWDYAQRNEKLKGTKGYWALNDAQYN